MNQFKSTILTITLLFLITACTSLPKKSEIVNVSHVSELSSWTARGKMLFVSGKEKESAYFYWQQNKNEFHFVLSTVLGIDVMTLKYEHGMATLKVDGEQHTSPNPQTLVARFTNKQIPFDKLHLWLLGHVNKQDISSPTYNNKNEIQSFDYMPEGFNQTSWNVKYGPRKPLQQLNLPSALTIKSSDSRIKLAISHWQLQG